MVEDFVGAAVAQDAAFANHVAAAGDLQRFADLVVG